MLVLKISIITANIIKNLIKIHFFDREKIAAILEINKLDLGNFLKISFFLISSINSVSSASSVSLATVVS